MKILTTMIRNILSIFTQNRIIVFLFLGFLSFSANAQKKNAPREEVGYLEFKGTAILEEKKLEGATVTVYKDNVKKHQTRTDKKGNFSFDLPFGYDYKITFSHPKCIDMQMAVFANIPKKKYNIWPIYENPMIYFFYKGDKTIDTSKYQFPFTKVVFNGKDGFKDDDKYFEEFKKGIFTEYKEAIALAEKQAKEAKEKAAKSRKKLTIAGKLFAGENRKPVANTKITLINEKGDTVKRAVTNAFGKFTFTELPPDQNFLLKVDESDVSLFANTKITLTSKAGKEIMTDTSGAKGDFNFKFIVADQNVLTAMAVEDNSLLIAGNLLSGTNSLKPVPNVKVILVNDKGDILQTAVTNALGGFVFTKLSPDQNFMVKTDENDTKLFANARMLIATKNGKEISSTTADANGKFIFQFLVSDTNKLASLITDDTELKTELKGKLLSGDNTKKALAGVKVRLINDKGDTIQTATTDTEGTFQFFDLPADKNYLMSIDEKDPKLASMNKVFLVDEKGGIIKEINADNNKSFNYQLLTTDQNTLSSVYVDDPWLKAMRPKTTTTIVYNNNASDFTINAAALTIRENIYFNANDYQLLPEARQLLDKVVEVMKAIPNLSIELSSHTDSKGAKEYNMELSKKRAKAAVDYIVARGIDPKRLIGKGYGETKLVNNCGDGVQCSEEEHAKNRRLEFVVERK